MCVCVCVCKRSLSHPLPQCSPGATVFTHKRLWVITLLFPSVSLRKTPDSEKDYECVKKSEMGTEVKKSIIAWLWRSVLLQLWFRRNSCVFSTLLFFMLGAKLIFLKWLTGSKSVQWNVKYVCLWHRKDHTWTWEHWHWPPGSWCRSPALLHWKQGRQHHPLPLWKPVLHGWPARHQTHQTFTRYTDKAFPNSHEKVTVGCQNRQAHTRYTKSLLEYRQVSTMVTKQRITFWFCLERFVAIFLSGSQSTLACFFEFYLSFHEDITWFHLSIHVGGNWLWHDSQHSTAQAVRADYWWNQSRKSNQTKTGISIHCARLYSWNWSSGPPCQMLYPNRYECCLERQLSLSMQQFATFWSMYL